MSDDPQDQAEALDDDVVAAADDRDGDVFGDAYAEYPPDELQLPIEALGEAPELDAADVGRALPGDDRRVGQLVDTDGPGLDDEERLLGEVAPGIALDPETRALHLEGE